MSATPDTKDWQARAEIYAFLGNSLLKVMTAETAVGLNPEFWANFPIQDGNELIVSGLSSLKAVGIALNKLSKEQAIEKVAVEYTRLFIGPGAPAAPPWETLYREGGAVFFGQPTLDMRRLIAAEGLQSSAESHQFEDHLGFELLYIGVRCLHVAELVDLQCPVSDRSAATVDEAIYDLSIFIQKHPLSFIEKLQLSASDAASAGYYPALLKLIWGILLRDVQEFTAHS